MPFGPMGWEPDQRAVEKLDSSCASFASAGHKIATTGEGKVVLLHDYIRQVAGGDIIREQTIGDCVSQAYAGAVDCLACVEIGLKKDHERWGGAENASEWIYWGSRVQVGKGRLGAGDGSVGAWAAEFVRDYGTLIRTTYGPVDLRKYSGDRAKAWGMPRFQPSPGLMETAKPYRVQQVSLVTTYEQVRDAIANGFPVVVCSNQGFTDQRDDDGFARASGVWGHALLMYGVDDNPRRPGILSLNSWGRSWISGPKRHKQADGSFWIDAAVINRMVGGQMPDSWALSNYAGYPRRRLYEMV